MVADKNLRQLFLVEVAKKNHQATTNQAKSTTQATAHHPNTQMIKQYEKEIVETSGISNEHKRATK